ncbi:hypothetical protein [Roseococcus sp. YIM B11640]|uniref:hypothetical protein n=1 Tax=Roseococcus sp. YIM B11640 TaxID=3133973 RepID=UPI003C7E2BAF
MPFDNPPPRRPGQQPERERPAPPPARERHVEVLCLLALLLMAGLLAAYAWVVE